MEDKEFEANSVCVSFYILCCNSVKVNYLLINSLYVCFSSSIESGIFYRQNVLCIIYLIREDVFSPNFISNFFIISITRCNFVACNIVDFLIKHCLKSVQIWRFFWSACSCIRTEYWKIQTKKTSVFGHFSGSENF